MNNNPVAKDCPISAEHVIDYLNQHRDFFADKPSLLTDMYLTHDSGDAISLVERQVAILRERNIDMRQRMNRLLDNARDNDKLFEKTKWLILELISAENLSGIADILLHGFHREFDIDYTSLLIYGEYPQTLSTNGARIVLLDEAKEHLGTFIDNHNVVCGQLSTGEQQFIFTDQASSINSTAVIPLKYRSSIGILAIGHSDDKHFHTGMDTLFLSYIGDVLARLLQKIYDDTEK